MSVAILLGVHDGLVLATDSASTLVVNPPPGQAQPNVFANVYDNANKIFNLIKGERIGCATYGTGSIGNASIATLIKDLRKQLTDPISAEVLGFNKAKYTVEQLCRILGKFLEGECSKIEAPAILENTNTGFLVGGYSTGESLGESWFVEISKGTSKDPVKLRENKDVGISFGGEGGEVVQRIVLGFSQRIFQTLAEVSQPEQNTPEFQQKLSELLRARLQAALVFAPMPIQDAIDLARFLVQSAISFSRFQPGYQVVGGPIEIAAITKHEGFKWIDRKYYFDTKLNPEIKPNENNGR